MGADQNHSVELWPFGSALRKRSDGCRVRVVSDSQMCYRIWPVGGAIRGISDLWGRCHKSCLEQDR